MNKITDPAVESLFFVLLRTARELEERMEAAFAEVGLSSARYGVLEQLARAREPLPLGELATRLQCVRSNMTQLVDRLEADELVRRVADPSDRRSVRAELTAKGQERQRVGAECLRRVESAFEASLSAEDRMMLERVLAVLGTNTRR